MFFRSVIVYEFEWGLRFSRGAFQGQVGPGRYVVRRHESIRIVPRQIVGIGLSSMEATTQDGAAMRIGFAITFDVIDPLPLIALGGGDATAARLRLEQLALSSAQACMIRWTQTRPFEQVIGSSPELQEAMVEAVNRVAESVGTRVNSLWISQFAPAGPIRTAQADLLKAELEARAALQRARGEASTMRSLINTARLLREHPGLLELRLLTSGTKPRINVQVGPMAGSAPSEAEVTDGTEPS